MQGGAGTCAVEIPPSYAREWMKIMEVYIEKINASGSQVVAG